MKRPVLNESLCEDWLLQIFWSAGKLECDSKTFQIIKASRTLVLEDPYFSHSRLMVIIERTSYFLQKKDWETILTTLNTTNCV